MHIGYICELIKFWMPILYFLKSKLMVNFIFISYSFVVKSLKNKPWNFNQTLNIADLHQFIVKCYEKGKSGLLSIFFIDLFDCIFSFVVNIVQMMKKNIQQGFVKKIVMLNICFKKVRRKFGKNMLTEVNRDEKCYLQGESF